MDFKIYTMTEIRAIPITDLREFAKEIGVRAPTTYTKEGLENAVYERLMQIDSARKAPDRLLPPRSDIGIINKSLIPEADRDKFGPFKKIPKGTELKSFAGWFRPYARGGGIVSRKFLPQSNDLFISQNFVAGLKLVMGDYIEGGFVESEEGVPDTVGQVNKVNYRSVTEHRAVDIFYADRLKPSVPLEIWSDSSDLRAFALATPLRYGSRILLSHGSDADLTDFNIRFTKTLTAAGVKVLPLFLGVLPEYAKEIEALPNSTACTFDTKEEHAALAVEMLIEAAYRVAEEGHDVAVVVDNIEVLGDADLVRKVLGCGCALERGSITVFASANEDIMDRRPYKTAETVVAAVMRFTCRRGVVTVDFKGSFLKTADADFTLFSRLSEIEGEALEAVVRNCPTRADAERLLK